MHTVHPSIIIGAYTWDQNRMPPDEFQIRLADLHNAMDEHGWKAMFLYGDAREHSAIAYYTNFVPRVRWAMALMPREGEPRLLASMSSRDMPAMKLMTWIPDVLSGWQWEGAFDPWLARLQGEAPIKVGTVGFDYIQPRLFRSVEKSLGERVRLLEAEGFATADRALRPRELSLVRDACQLVRVAARAMVQAWRGGAGAEAAMLAGERTARGMAAQDVRTLVSLDGGRTLVPFQGNLKVRPESFVGYIAVKVMGFWAELFVTLSAGGGLLHGVQKSMEVLKDAAKPGASAAQLHALAMKTLDSRPLHPVLSGSVGRRIGLSLNEGEELRHHSAHALKAPNVYALHVGTCDAERGALASAMVAVTAKGVELLCSSEDALTA
ncbi:MAG: hypothetical protein A3G27_11795 [Betaproteobacteria bacterium RIFCSPLOWO2_12_FULL_66_14]|nr:MAG: hypothetical protein A3G27_11795 [Betaproteobacteria bacterium RIFCSPLOWO2_12_FULL_66_14]